MVSFSLVEAWLKQLQPPFIRYRYRRCILWIIAVGLALVLELVGSRVLAQEVSYPVGETYHRAVVALQKGDRFDWSEFEEFRDAQGFPLGGVIAFEDVETFLSLLGSEEVKLEQGFHREWKGFLSFCFLSLHVQGDLSERMALPWENVFNDPDFQGKFLSLFGSMSDKPIVRERPLMAYQITKQWHLSDAARLNNQESKDVMRRLMRNWLLEASEMYHKREGASTGNASRVILSEIVFLWQDLQKNESFWGSVLLKEAFKWTDFDSGNETEISRVWNSLYSVDPVGVEDFLADQFAEIAPEVELDGRDLNDSLRKWMALEPADKGRYKLRVLKALGIYSVIDDPSSTRAVWSRKFHSPTKSLLFPAVLIASPELTDEEPTFQKSNFKPGTAARGWEKLWRRFYQEEIYQGANLVKKPSNGLEFESLLKSEIDFWRSLFSIGLVKSAKGVHVLARVVEDMLPALALSAETETAFSVAKILSRMAHSTSPEEIVLRRLRLNWIIDSRLREGEKSGWPRDLVREMEAKVLKKLAERGLKQPRITAAMLGLRRWWEDLEALNDQRKRSQCSRLVK